jgi:cell division protein FtsI/penicillin-binding protein 2
VGLTFSVKPRRRFWRPRTLIALGAVLAVGAAAFFLTRDDNDAANKSDLPTHEVDTFLKAWSAGNTKAMAVRLDAAPAKLAESALSLILDAPGSRAKYTRTSLVADKIGTGATATYRAHVDVAGFGPLEWKGVLPLVQVQQTKTKDSKPVAQWRIHWQPDIIYPGLLEGQHLTLQRSWLTRANITATDGTLLGGPQEIVTIGLEPDRIKNLPHIKDLLKTLTNTDAATVDAALNAPGVMPNYFVPVVTVPYDERYRTVLRPQLFPVHGVFFQRSRGELGASNLLGSQLIGSVGEITADRLKELGAPYRAGDLVGLSGLQAAYETRLAGTPNAAIVLELNGKVVRTVKKLKGRAPQPVTVTIDAAVQQAAESALAGVTLPAGLVAIDVPTGQIRAVVSKPDNGFERAIDGAYPPGSTFKVITSAALLMGGNSGSTPAPCPAALTVNGRVFHNFEGESAGALSLAGAFQISCNNAFIGLADKLPSEALPDAAKLFGFGAKYSLGVPTYGGTFPEPIDRAELAASAIGQGRILASPAQMASVAAAVASGQWHQPVLTTKPAPRIVATPAALSGGVVATLQSFMASVTQSGGTAAGAGLPAGTSGKTGTAEFGNGNPPPTHAWFIGYRGNLAFAVVVEGGGVGGQVAAPLAANFLNALPG